MKYDFENIKTNYLNCSRVSIIIMQMMASFLDITPSHHYHNNINGGTQYINYCIY